MIDNYEHLTLFIMNRFELAQKYLAIKFDCLIKLAVINSSRSYSIDQKHYDIVTETWDLINNDVMFGCMQRNKYDLGKNQGIQNIYMENFPAKDIFVYEQNDGVQTIFDPNALHINVPVSIEPYESILRELFYALFILSNIANDDYDNETRSKPIIIDDDTYDPWFFSFVDNIRNINSIIIKDTINGKLVHGTSYELCSIDRVMETNDDVRNAIDYASNYFPLDCLSYDKQKSSIVFTVFK